MGRGGGGRGRIVQEFHLEWGTVFPGSFGVLYSGFELGGGGGVILVSLKLGKKTSDCIIGCLGGGGVDGDLPN